MNKLLTELVDNIQDMFNPCPHSTAKSAASITCFGTQTNDQLYQGTLNY